MFLDFADFCGSFADFCGILRIFRGILRTNTKGTRAKGHQCEALTCEREKTYDSSYRDFEALLGSRVKFKQPRMSNSSNIATSRQHRTWIPSTIEHHPSRTKQIQATSNNPSIILITRNEIIGLPGLPRHSFHRVAPGCLQSHPHVSQARALNLPRHALEAHQHDLKQPKQGRIKPLCIDRAGTSLRGRTRPQTCDGLGRPILTDWDPTLADRGRILMGWGRFCHRFANLSSTVSPM